jgi:hypothetical protein
LGRPEAASLETGVHNLWVETGENSVKMNENEGDFAQNRLKSRAFLHYSATGTGNFAG